VSVVNAPAWSGRGNFPGVASNYLANASPGRKVSVMIRPSANFHLPDDSDIPIIMVGAGSGIAPFRGFIQERAARLLNGQSVAKALLFFGCHDPNCDFLYHDELSTWSKVGVVTVFSAFSTSGQYVQDVIWAHRTEVGEVFGSRGRIYVCGDGMKMAPAVRKTFLKIYQEVTHCSEDTAESWLNEMERIKHRFVTDIFE